MSVFAFKRRNEAKAEAAAALDQRVFEAQLAEYLTSRDEMIAAITNQQYVLTFGNATTLAAFGAGIVAWEHRVFSAAIFFAIPALATWVLIAWTGEVARMLRSVHFCSEQEKRINETLASASFGPALRWETWRQDERHPERTIKWTYMATIAFWVLLSSAAVAVSALRMQGGHGGWPWWAMACMALVWIVLEVPVALWIVFGVFKPWQRASIGIPGQGDNRSSHAESATSG